MTTVEASFNSGFEVSLVRNVRTPLGWPERGM